MFNTVAEILDIRSEDRLKQIFREIELELIHELHPLERLLDNTVHSMDPRLNYNHADEVGRWRNKVSKFQMFLTALVEHAKSDNFLIPKSSGVTESVRESHMRGLAGPFVAWRDRLERMINDIDNRVNFCKKLIESEKTGYRQPSSGAEQF